MQLQHRQPKIFVSFQSLEENVYIVIFLLTIIVFILRERSLRHLREEPFL